MNELRNKARYFEKSGIVPTLDATATIVKSDTIVDAELHSDVSEAFAALVTDQAKAPDWHPRSDNMVQDLVHPSMYPLVYGETNVLRTEVVGVEDAIDKWSGKGETIQISRADRYHETDFNPRAPDPPWEVGGTIIPPEFWSEKYQWLPANVKFQDDGAVKFESYINNLHPIKHAGIYKTIEKLVQKALPMWDQCLTTIAGSDRLRPVRTGAGRTSSRFVVGDAEYVNSIDIKHGTTLHAASG